MVANLHLNWCSRKAAKYAVEHWHYSKTMPCAKLVCIGVWENKIFKGAVIFGQGATATLVKQYGLTQFQGCELVRVALKDHENTVSKIISIAIKLLKKKCPKLRLIVSFADPNQGHEGKIYQAGNWIYAGKSDSCFFYKDKRTNRMRHPRGVAFKNWGPGKCVWKKDCIPVKMPGKHRYLMPLDKEMKEQIIPLAQPYPHASEALE